MLTIDDKIRPLAIKLRAKGSDTRSATVEAVDSYHGYTMEFAPSPVHHRELYDLLEEQLNELEAKP